MFCNRVSRFLCGIILPGYISKMGTKDNFIMEQGNMEPPYTTLKIKGILVKLIVFADTIKVDLHLRWLLPKISELRNSERLLYTKQK